MWHSLPFAALDVEAKADSAVQPLAPAQRIVEIAWVECDQKDAEFTQLLSSPGKIDADSQKVHGITDAELEGQPEFKEVIPALKKMLQSTHFVLEYSAMSANAHGDGFDMAMLRKELRLAGLRFLVEPIMLDVCVMIRQLDKYVKTAPGEKGRHALWQACRRRGLPEPGHRALTDARALASLFRSIRGEVHKAMGEPQTVEEAAKILRQWKRDQDADYAAWKARASKASTSAAAAPAAH